MSNIWIKGYNTTEPDKQFAKYKKHRKDHSEGHIFLDKDGACTITLTGAASMTQDELDYYGELFTKALNGENEDE